MRRRWPTLLIASVVGLALASCHHSNTRKLRQPYVEEYEVPPKDDRRFSEPPTYPEQRRQLPGPKTPNMPNMPSLRGGGGGGPGGPGGSPF